MAASRSAAVAGAKFRALWHAGQYQLPAGTARSLGLRQKVWYALSQPGPSQRSILHAFAVLSHSKHATSSISSSSSIPCGSSPSRIGKTLVGRPNGHNGSRPNTASIHITGGDDKRLVRKKKRPQTL
eukprot:1176273-Prorocentrum_minimum.AAC.1